MKPSSSSSPSSAAPEPNFRSSSRKQKPRCLIHILRHLLCSKSIPTYPSEGAIIDKEAEPNEKIVEEVVPTAPIQMSGTVARLMGLEPLPEKPDSPSHGVSGIDQYQKHGRATTLASSGRMPIACFELENEEFLLLTFDCRRGNSKRKELKQMRTEEFEKREERTPLLPRCKKEKGKRSSRKSVAHREDKNLKCMSDSSCQIADSSVRISMQEKPINSNEVSETKKMTSRCSVEAENNKENSSPVSVLECSEFYAKPEADTSVQQSWLEGAKARRKLATSPETSCIEERSTQAIEGKALKDGEKGGEYDNSLNVWADICKYAAEAATNSRWVHKTSLESEDFQEIRAKIGSQILDELLDELTDQT